MKKIITLVCLLLLAGTAAWDVSLIGSGIGGYECVDALIYQNFEGTGYDNEESWAADAYCDPDYTGIEASNILNCRWFYELVYFLFLFLAGTAWGGSLIGSGVGDECTGALICQNFEDTGYDNGESWTEYNYVDPDYDGVNVLRGDQSIELSYDNGAPYVYKNFTEDSEIWAHARWRSTFLGAHVPIIRFDTSDGSEKIFEVHAGSDYMRIYCGTILASSSLTPELDTTYHIWLHIDAADKSGELYMGTTTTRPSSPVASVTGGDNTSTSMARINLTGWQWADATDCGYFDQVIVKTSEFTSVKE